MPATLGGQITIVLGLIALVTFGVRAFRIILQHVEWLEQLWIVYARQTGADVPEWLLKKHMKMNGNTNRTFQEKEQIYGKGNVPPIDSGK